MGNRAVITTSKSKDVKNSKDIGVYLHYNGGRDSVKAFLKYCELKGYRSPSEDNYGWARLCQVIGNFFGGSTSIGIDNCCHLDCDNFDNGVYIIKSGRLLVDNIIAEQSKTLTTFIQCFYLLTRLNRYMSNLAKNR